MKKILIPVLFLHLSLAAYSQMIKGTILDQKTHEAIYSASIYFNGTFVGVLSDKDGKFVIDISKYPSMPLTISALGYFTSTLENYPKDKPLLVYLTPKLFEIEEVVVKSKSRKFERREDLTIFRNEFLGKTTNALNCVITNEEDIRFKYNSKDTIIAYAIKPLLIENKALGYRITYYLDRFEYYKASESFFFKGNIIFKEDMTTDTEKNKLIERKRKYAYLGSRMHFFRSLWINDINAAGFTVKNPANETLNYSKIVTQEGDGRKFLRYPGGLGLCYYSKVQTSYIVFLKERVFFDKNGFCDPAGISWEGQMAVRRIADQLPFEYNPEE
jgi:hypothetical protein